MCITIVIVVFNFTVISLVFITIVEVQDNKICSNSISLDSTFLLVQHLLLKEWELQYSNLNIGRYMGVFMFVYKLLCFGMNVFLIFSLIIIFC